MPLPPGRQACMQGQPTRCALPLSTHCILTSQLIAGPSFPTVRGWLLYTASGGVTMGHQRSTNANQETPDVANVACLSALFSGRLQRASSAGYAY